MSWGLGRWGIDPWGGLGAGASALPPTLLGVSSFPGPTASPSSPAVISRIGGTVCIAIGTDFYDPMTIEFLTGDVIGGYTVVGTGYVFFPRYDVESSRVFFGAPALADGLYHLRISTDSGVSGVLEDVIESRLFAEEHKVLSVRDKYAERWRVGPRILRTAK